MQDLISLLLPDDLDERCGLIVNDKIVEVANIHLEPTKGFRMDPEELMARVDDATATWHTHPASDPGLSEQDYAGFTQWPNLVHHIIGVRDGEPTIESYRVTNGLVIKL